MDLSWASKPLFLRLKRASERPKACISPVSTEDEDMSAADDRLSFVELKPNATVRIISPEKEVLNDDGHRKPNSFQPSDQFSSDDNDDYLEFSVAKESSRKLGSSSRININGNRSALSVKPACCDEMIVWDGPTKEYHGWGDDAPLQRSSLPKSNKYFNDFDEDEGDEDDAYADNLSYSASESISNTSEVKETDDDADNLEDELSIYSDASTEPVVTGHDADPATDMPLLDNNDFSDEPGLQPDEYDIEEWHGCRFVDYGRKEVYLKWKGYRKKQWLKDFYVNATDYAVEELEDKCKRFPPCPSCSAGVPHTCWKIEEYVQCQGIFARKVVDGILLYKIKWLNDQDAWVVAGQFSESSWEKVKGMTKRIRCISCDRKDPNHTCLDNGATIVPSGLKSAVTYRPKARRKQLPLRAKLSSLRGKSTPSKRKASSQTVKAKTKKQRTARPRKAAAPRNPAPLFAGGSRLQIGGQVIKEIVFQSDDSPPVYDCLAACFFGNRLRSSKWDEKKEFLATRDLVEIGETWKLLFPVQPARSKNFVYINQKPIPQQQAAIKVFYVAVRTKDGELMDLQHELELLGDFSSLATEKVVARLKLLFTDAKRTNFVAQPRCIFSTPADLYTEIEDRGDGCGFFSKELFTKLFDDENKRRKYKDVAALQVRIVCPRLGFFKGVLMLKDIMSGHMVQLPPSMKKVPPSKHDDLKETAVILIRQTFPSLANITLEKYWKTGQITESDTRTREQGMKDGFIKFLSKAFKMKDSELQKILSDSKRLPSIKHVGVVGVADCTDAIPSGMAYLSGFQNIPNFQVALKQRSLFVSRFPCIERNDARRVTIVTTKPSQMAPSQWEFLQSLPFGVIMFGFDAGKRATPAQIANGDLDGDLYFVSWDQRLLDLDLLPIFQVACSEEPTVRALPRNPHWLESAHEVMTNVENSGKYGILISRVYRLWEKATKELDEAEFAVAYKQSLDIEKHGGKITLPARSWEKLRPALHCLLQEPKHPELTSILRKLYYKAADDVERSELCQAYRASLDIEASNGVIVLPELWWDSIPRRFHSLLSGEE